MPETVLAESSPPAEAEANFYATPETKPMAA